MKTPVCAAQIFSERVETMVQISRDEAGMIRDVFGDGVSVYRTCRQKSKRHRYLMSCESYAVNAVKEFQNGTSVEMLKQKYARYRRYGRPEWTY